MRLDEARRRAVQLIRETGGITKRPESGAIPLGDGLGLASEMKKVKVAANIPVLSLDGTRKMAEIFGKDYGFVPKVSVMITLTVQHFNTCVYFLLAIMNLKAFLFFLMFAFN